MKFSLILFFFIISFGSASAQQTKLAKKPDPLKPLMEVEAACGMCKFGLKDKDCLLTIRKDEKTWYVKGTDINDHGDAHSDDGFCNATRRAKVQGEVKGDVFVVTYFKLVPQIKK